MYAPTASRWLPFSPGSGPCGPLPAVISRRVSTASSVMGCAGVVTLACDGYSNRSCHAFAYARPPLRFFGSFPSSCLRSYDPQSRGFIADPPRAFFVLLALIPTSERRSYEDCRRLRASSGKL